MTIPEYEQFMNIPTGMRVAIMMDTETLILLRALAKDLAMKAQDEELKADCAKAVEDIDRGAKTASFSMREAA